VDYFLAIKYAVIKFAEVPPSKLFHGLNNADAPVFDSTDDFLGSNRGYFNLISGTMNQEH
jgi:hypothetical protein